MTEWHPIVCNSLVDCGGVGGPPAGLRVPHGHHALDQAVRLQRLLAPARLHRPVQQLHARRQQGRQVRRVLHRLEVVVVRGVGFPLILLLLLPLPAEGAAERTIGAEHGADVGVYRDAVLKLFRNFSMQFWVSYSFRFVE